jgi:hypothetical protein
MLAPDARTARTAGGGLAMTGIAAPNSWRRHGRTTAVVIAAAGLVMAGCAGSSSSTGGSPNGSTNPPSAVAFSGCMRSHGLPNYPDPGSSGALPKTNAQALGVSSSQFQAAETACQHLLPSVGGSFQQQTDQCIVASDCPQALVQRILNVQRNYARCMRSHGFPSWPDPTIDSQGTPFSTSARPALARLLPGPRSGRRPTVDVSAS